jgi:hypothetical protein
MVSKNRLARLRPKGNLMFEHKGGEITAAEVGKMPSSKAVGAVFNNSNISTNIGYLHESSGTMDPTHLTHPAQANVYSSLQNSIQLHYHFSHTSDVCNLLSSQKLLIEIFHLLARSDGFQGI